jgi:hypothetical protein
VTKVVVSFEMERDKSRAGHLMDWNSGTFRRMKKGLL